MESKEHLLEEEKGGGLNYELLQLRRADYEDANAIMLFLEGGKKTKYLHIYSTTEIMHLIETSFLPIVVLLPDGQVVAFATIDHSPLVSLYRKLFM